MKKTEERVRRDREQWSALVAEWRASGPQGREFARLKGNPSATDGFQSG
jgi:hypothetical protein